MLNISTQDLMLVELFIIFKLEVMFLISMRKDFRWMTTNNR